MGTCPNVPHGSTSAPWRRTKTVFRAFRRFLAALDALRVELRGVCVELSELCAAYKDQGPAIGRLEALELSRHQWEAMCEGLLQKADGKLKAANNAEARERANKKSYERLLDPLAEIGDGPEATQGHPDSGNDVAAGEAERVQALRVDVALTPKQLAQRAKWGVR